MFDAHVLRAASLNISRGIVLDSGTGTITAEIAGLFSTVSAYKALTTYETTIRQLK
jgi:hypothetical protein